MAEVSDKELSSGVLPERLEEPVAAAGPEVTIEAVTSWFTACASAVVISDTSELGVVEPASWLTNAGGLSHGGGGSRIPMPVLYCSIDEAGTLPAGAPMIAPIASKLHEAVAELRRLAL